MEKEIKKMITTIIRETCTHWICADQEDFDRVEKELEKKLKALIIKEANTLFSSQIGEKAKCSCGLIIPDDRISFHNGCNDEGEAYYVGKSSCVCGKKYSWREWSECESLSDAKRDLKNYVTNICKKETPEELASRLGFPPMGHI